MNPHPQGLVVSGPVKILTAPPIDFSVKIGFCQTHNSTKIRRTDVKIWKPAYEKLCQRTSFIWYTIFALRRYLFSFCVAFLLFLSFLFFLFLFSLFIFLYFPLSLFSSLSNSRYSSLFSKNKTREREIKKTRKEREENTEREYLFSVLNRPIELSPIR